MRPVTKHSESVSNNPSGRHESQAWFGVHLPKRGNSTYDAADRLIQAGANTYSYDANGNQTSSNLTSGTQTLAFDSADRLTSVTQPVTGTQSQTRSPASCTQVENANGTVAWTNPANAQVLDTTNVARTSLNAAQSEYLQCTQFGFDLPTGATIAGVQIRITEKASVASAAREARVSAIKNGEVSIVDRGGSLIPTTWTEAVRGSTTELWSLNWSETEVESASTGALISASRPAR
jgi:YD repeat-containing protein